MVVSAYAVVNAAGVYLVRSVGTTHASGRTVRTSFCSYAEAEDFIHHVLRGVVLVAA